MTAPLDLDSSAQVATPEAVLAGMGPVEGRSLTQIAWLRLKRDKLALGSGLFILFLVIVAILAPLITKITGGSPTEFHTELIDPNYGTPIGHLSGISSTHILGVEPVNGRDVFARIVYGARVSLTIAFLATGVSVAIGVVMGMMAGYFGGIIDSAISRLMDVLLAFPLLLFAIALVAVLTDYSLPGLGLDNTRVAILVLIIGFFNWPYIGRIIRGQTLSLREKEYVEAARSLGAGPGHILFKELLPNLVGPILVYATLIIPVNILFEAALSFLGVGVRLPNPSWGGMLSIASQGWFQIDPFFMVVPGLALLLTVMAFNLFGDGLRDALDPKANR
ncbi:MAG: peptide/nickel transport system permease protein [Frankiales bacterium]|nr:peptide/nickel transport system permease protein [Frankiales bacterium]